MQVKKESEKIGLKLNIKKKKKKKQNKTKVMASSSITSWQIDGEKIETVQTLFSRAPESLWAMMQAWN